MQASTTMARRLLATTTPMRARLGRAVGVPAILCMFALDGTVLAQESRGTIEGSVADTSGGVLPGATITIVNT